MVEVSVYGKKAKVNVDNPAFSSYTGKKIPYAEVKAMITNGHSTWRESFKVTSFEVAETQIKEVIQFFNDTIHVGEKPRSFVDFYYEDRQASKYEDGEGMSGWLDPEGIFHPCGFGGHIVYALNLAQENRIGSGNEEMEELALNQHIPMSITEQSSGSFMSILSNITSQQVDWFNRFFFKLAPVQKSALARAAKEQNITLKYDW